MKYKGHDIYEMKLNSLFISYVTEAAKSPDDGRESNHGGGKTGNCEDVKCGH